MIDKYGTGYLMPSEFTPDDIIDALLAIDDDNLALKRKNCKSFSLVENWGSYEPALLSLYQTFCG